MSKVQEDVKDAVCAFGCVFGELLKRVPLEGDLKKGIICECATILAAFASSDVTPEQVDEHWSEINKGLLEGRRSIEAFRKSVSN